ncbi:MAG: thymidine kinase [Acholeplasmatales bacterium]|nr:thymidine kinase [Acholeplasmatales bacterium]
MNYYENQKGWVETICGPMFAGKTEELFKIIKRMEFAHKKYLIFKPAIDSRYSETEIVSHNQNKLPAISIQHGREIKRNLKKDTQAVVIDEIQFFDKSMLKYIQELAADGLRVIVAGLDRDFRGESFGVTGDCMAISDKVIKLTAVCACCGAEATMTQRIIDGKPAYYDDPQVLVGASDVYEPRCRNCHKVLKDE